MKYYHLKVEPNSEAEQYFMEAMKHVTVPTGGLKCRLGIVFMTPYNEYIMTEETYMKFREYFAKTSRKLEPVS